MNGAREAARVRLFCFPHAGGGPRSFASWSARLPRSIDFCVARLPGREQRLTEKPFTEWPPLLEELAAVFAADRDRRPFIFFGHSLGGALAYELTCKLSELSLVGPRHLVVAGCRSPDVPLRAPRMARLATPELIMCLNEIDDASSEALGNPLVMEMLMPTLRADIWLAETWCDDPGRPKLDIPITVLCAQEDPIASPNDSRGWRSRTSDVVSVHCFPGNHFFIRSAEDRVLDLLGSLCSEQ
jgi:medium-chain acyl-[acyl-carrier-protein] hydrolase